MKKLFVLYEIALKLKELGFNEPCLAAYDRIEMFCTHSTEILKPLNYNTGGNYTSAPLYQQVIDWFREEYNIDIHCPNYYRDSKDPHYKNRREYECRVNGRQLGFEGSSHSSVILFDKYYEALNKAIEEAIKLTGKK